MTNDKKRSAPQPGASASKKRKMEQKYYAVRAGKVPGVYLTYDECKEQCAGFKGAVCKFCSVSIRGRAFVNSGATVKSFMSKADAEAFASGKAVEVKSATCGGAKNEPEKFYAVARGSPPGIYSTWEECSLATKCKAPKFKKFATRAEAVEFMRMHGTKQAKEAIGEDTADGEATPTEALPEGFVEIHTDGASRGNGQVGARAGYGVYFGPGDKRNLAGRLPGKLQTNQRAELMAILKAIGLIAIDQPIQIVTDSRYSIQCVTDWPASWKKNGWKTASGQPVKNVDLIEVIVDKIEERWEKNGAKTKFKWVKGHQGNAGNIAADALAVKGADMPEVA